MKNPRSCWKGFCILLLMLCFALTGTSVAQNQYYIAPTGSDSNDGSKAHPWKTINHADAALTVGSPGVCTAESGWTSVSGVGACVHVISGNYPVAITTNKGGTSSARIAYVSDTQYGAKLTGSGVAIWSNRSSYVDVVGFDFDGTSSSSQNGLINYYTPANDGTMGCHNEILNNKAHDICNAGSCRQGPGGMGTSGTDLNLTASCGNLYQSNLLYHINGGGGTTFNDGSANGAISAGWGDIVQDNVIVDIGGECIGASHTSTHNVITNNTVINCKAEGIMLWHQLPGLNDFTTVSNNLVVNGGAAGIREFSTNGCGPNNIYANNLMYGNAGGNYAFDGACPNTSTGTLSGTNSTTFVNYTGTISGDYHLKAGSTAIGGGTTACAAGRGGCVPPVDFAGNARRQVSDIGSYAFAMTGELAPPTGLTASVQ